MSVTNILTLDWRAELWSGLRLCRINTQYRAHDTACYLPARDTHVKHVVLPKLSITLAEFAPQGDTKPSKL